MPPRRCHGLATALLLGLVTLPGVVGAESYRLSGSSEIVGDTIEVAVRDGEILLDIARQYNMGYAEMRLANVDVDPWHLKPGDTVTIPGRRILPAGPRQGIVLNLAERRLYYFSGAGNDSARQIFTYPVGIGREEWPTPLGPTRVVGKLSKPSWYPPLSVRVEHAAKGDPLPAVVFPGPDNPLGEYALVLEKPGYLIHGTNKPGGIGLRVSHGCVRMYPEDIKALFQRVPVGEEVLIVDQPYKAAVYDGRLYVEIHPADSDLKNMESLRRVIQDTLKGRSDISWRDVQWRQVNRAFRQADGMPVAVTPPSEGADRQQTVKRAATPAVQQGSG